MLLCDMCNDSQWLTRRRGARLHVTCMGSDLTFASGSLGTFVEIVSCTKEFYLPPGIAFISTVTDPGFLEERFAKPQKVD